MSRSFLKIQFLFPKSQLNAVTCSCHCKRVWVATVVHTKHWPAFLVWTWALLAQKKNCCNNSIWTEPLDSLFLFISVTVCHKNLLNRKYEQNLCLWEFFFYLFTERNQKNCFRVSLSDFRNVGKVEMWQLCSSLDAFCPFVWHTEPCAFLRMKDNHIEQEGFLEGREKLPTAA